MYKEFVIPKKNGKVRKICAPNTKLKRMQKEKLKDITELWKNLAKHYGVYNVQHGFIPHRNVVTAAQQHVHKDCTIIMDLSNFFDSCYKHMITSITSSQVVKEDFLYHKDGYTAQGFPTSPMLANIAILPALSKVKEFLAKHNAVVTMYADDIQISLNLDNDTFDLQNSIISTVTSIIESYGFSINKGKTRIRYNKYGYKRILGVNVRDEVRASRKTMRKIRAAKHQGNHHSLAGLTTWSKCLLPKSRRH